MSEKKEEFKFKPEVRSIADRLVPLMLKNIEDKGSEAVIKDNDYFKTIATEDGRNVDQMLDDDKYRSDFLAGSRLAAGEASLAHMKKKKDIARVEGTFEIGRSTFEVSFDRHKRVDNRVVDKENGGFKTEGQKDLYGDSAGKFTVYGGRNSRGEQGKIRDYLREEFSNAFGS